MEFLNFLREDPVMAWLVFLGILLTVVPAANVIWRKLSGRKTAEEVEQPMRTTRPFRFGFQTELVLLLVGILWLLAIIGGIRSFFH
jgi:hypothetical protein